MSHPTPHDTASSTPAGVAPTLPQSRYDLIDIVRGFALFGVMLANMVWTSQWFALNGAQRAALPTADIDRAASFFLVLLVDYKFYTLFSMLFGLGFAMQLSRSATNEKHLLSLYRRRLTILFAIGVAHALLLWFGDILHVYAIVGFVLILLRKWSDKALLWLAFGIAVYVASLPFVQWALITTGLIANGESQDMATTYFAALSAGNWLDIMRVNWSFGRSAYIENVMGFDGPVYWYLSVLWKFIIGFVIGRRMLLQHSQQNIAFFKRLFPWALILGLGGNAIFSFVNWRYDVWLADDSSALSLVWIPLDLCMFALSMAYLCGLVLLYQRPACRRCLSVLAPVGRMALTNYLAQSALLVILFYGVGLGLIGKVGAAGCILICLVLFSVQIVISGWWLRRFQFGPAEWLWRCLTYSRWQGFRKV